MIDRLIAQALEWAAGHHDEGRYSPVAIWFHWIMAGLVVFQLGWGRYARLFKSSITDQTTAVGTAWAKDKAATNTLLRMGGLPVPEQRSVASLDVAVKEAAALGYPVVLKPVNLAELRNTLARLLALAAIRAGRSLRGAFHGARPPRRARTGRKASSRCESILVRCDPLPN